VKPAVAAWLLTALFAIAVSASVFRIPIQVSDSVEILEAVDRTPSVAAAFMQRTGSATATTWCFAAFMPPPRRC
jgi:hypothetical protein